MADITFFTNPMSRGQIARWALHEVGAEYDEIRVDWGNKPPGLLVINPLGKVPTIIHHAPEGDRVVSEVAAVCAYLGDAFPDAGLAPTMAEKANFYRWMFFAAGPLEQGITARAYGFEPDERQKLSVGFGELDTAIAMLEAHLASHQWVCGSRFTMADVSVGSQIDFGLQFGTLPDRAAFSTYVERLRAREAYQAARAIDHAQIAEMQGES